MNKRQFKKLIKKEIYDFLELNFPGGRKRDYKRAVNNGYNQAEKERKEGYKNEQLL